MTRTNENIFRTTSFYVAVFLFVKGVELINIIPTDSKRSEFIFKDTPERENLVQTFNFGREDAREVLVDVRKLVTAIKVLKDKLYQGF